MESGLVPKVSPEEAQANFRLAIESGMTRVTLHTAVVVEPTVAEVLAGLAFCCCCRCAGMAYDLLQSYCMTSCL